MADRELGDFAGLLDAGRPNLHRFGFEQPFGVQGIELGAEGTFRPPRELVSYFIQPQAINEMEAGRRWRQVR